MAGFQASRLTALPGLLKPVIFVVLLIYLILMAASYYDPGWWIWMTLIMQFVVVIVTMVMMLFSLDAVLFHKRTWTIMGMFYSGTWTVLNLANTIVQLTLLIKENSSVFGVGALLCFGLVALYGLNTLMMYRVWRQDVTSAQAPGPGVRPGNTGNMNPGLESGTGAYPGGAVAPTPATASYPPAIPPGATFPPLTNPR